MAITTPAAQTFTSKFLSLQTRDFVKGLLIAALSPVFTIIIQSVNAGNWVFEWKSLGATALSAGLAYLAKNFFESTKTVIVVEPKDEKIL